MVWHRKSRKKSNKNIRLVRNDDLKPRQLKPKNPSKFRTGLGRLRRHMDNFTSSKWVNVVIFSLLAILIIGSNISLDSPTSYKTWHMTVLSGDTLQYKNKTLKLRGVTCPSVDTEEGLEAKRLANSYIFSSGTQASTVSCKSTFWSGLGTITCKRDTARASLSEFLVNSGLCKGE